MDFSRHPEKLLDRWVIVIWQADMDHLTGDESLGDNVESFSSLADTDHKGRVDKGMINLIVLNYQPSLSPFKNIPIKWALRWN